MNWFNLVLMCGLVFSVLLNETSGGLSSVDPEMRSAMEMLQTKHKLTGTEWMRKAVFTPYLDKMRSTCTCEKMVLLSMLNIYTDIFEAMKIKDTENKESLTVFQKAVDNLKPKYAMEHGALQQIQKIASIDPKDRRIQGGALIEFIAVFNQANTTVHRTMSHKKN